MIDKHIEVITTDTTTMMETGFGSIETCKAFCDILRNQYTRVNFNVATSAQDLADIAAQNPDLVVPCVKYICEQKTDRKVWLSEFFSLRAVAHTGSNRATLEYDSNKGDAKRAVLGKGLASANFFFASPNMIKIEALLPLPLPLFVKPIDAANGNGIDQNSLVHDFASFEAKVEEIYAIYGVPALVEEYLSGREFTVAVLDDPVHNSRLISPVEIIVPANCNGDRILGHTEKLGNKEKLAIVHEPELSLISNLVDKVFSVLGIRDFGRIDIKMDANRTPYFMEANLIPGMTPGTSYFPRACFHNQKLSHEEVVLRIVELALLRTELPANTPPTDLIRKLLPVEKFAA